MNITTTGRHIEVTDAMKSHLADKLKKLDRHASEAVTVNAVFHLEKELNIVHIDVHFGKNHLRAEGKTKDMYQSMDEAVDKIVRQIH